MPVNVIGTLKPKNNGKFPVAEAVDIKVSDNLRLDEALENKADLATLNFALSGKANNSDINNLQEQINLIITPVTQDAEVQNARVGADGTSYETLKARLDAEAVEAANNINNIEIDVQNLAENNEYNLYFSDTWQNKDVTVSENTVTLTPSSKTVFSGYVDISSLDDNDEYNVTVPDGYRAYLWGIDKNDGTYTKSYNSGGWITSASDFTHRALSSTYGYIIIKVQKTDNSDISVSEGNQIKLYVTKQTEISKTVADLSTSQTELVGDVGELSTDVDSIKTEISGIEQGQIQTELEIPISFTSGRVTLSANTITTAENPKFAYFKFAKLEYGKEYSIYIPSGIDIFAYIVNRTNDTYTRMEEFTPAWESGEQTFKNTVSSIMQDYELVLSAKKTNNTNITVEEANGVKVTYLDETELPFMTNLKQAMGFKPVATKGQILYNADSKSESDYIVNAVSYNDGTIIGCRSDGRVVRVNLDGTEETLLTITGSGFDWRCCYIDKNENVYVSPHATWGSMNVADRGLYKLSKGENSFVKVLALYDSSSSDPVLTQNNDDTIWTMCEDDNGYLYAGVYSHTVRFRPRIYKSTDGGNTWTCVVDFISSGIAPNGNHIHCVVYSRWQKALYCIIGELNTIWKSVDGGVSWLDLDIELTVKGTTMLPTPNGIIVGSDGAYNCNLDILYNDDKTHETVFSGWANTVFGTRVSDITGFIYVFTKIDSSVNNAEYMPPYGVLHGTKTLAAWKAGDYTDGHVPTHLAEWEEYNASVANTYPDDAIRPQHYSILISRDGGKTFEILKAIECSSAQANGIWTVGSFENGECLCGVYHNGAVSNPIVISEGKHKFVAGGCDLTGEIFVRTNTSPIIQL